MLRRWNEEIWLVVVVTCTDSERWSVSVVSRNCHHESWQVMMAAVALVIGGAIGSLSPRSFPPRFSRLRRLQSLHLLQLLGAQRCQLVNVRNGQQNRLEIFTRPVEVFTRELTYSWTKLVAERGNRILVNIYGERRSEWQPELQLQNCIASMRRSYWQVLPVSCSPPKIKALFRSKPRSPNRKCAC